MLGRKFNRGSDTNQPTVTRYKYDLTCTVHLLHYLRVAVLIFRKTTPFFQLLRIQIFPSRILPDPESRIQGKTGTEFNPKIVLSSSKYDPECLFRNLVISKQ
jgi:hypothetical protein